MLKDACVSSIPSAPRAFYYCGSLGRLTSISLPDGLTSIGNQAFSGCESLALTSLPDGLTSIGDYTFYKCTSLALTSLPHGLTSIEEGTFFFCTSLALTSLPDGCTSIGYQAFGGGCASLGRRVLRRVDDSDSYCMCHCQIS